jgi:hypothetical protein
MAGRPKLRQLANLLNEDGAADRLFENIANGSTFSKEATRLGVSRAALYEWMNGDDSRKERLTHARQCQAIGHVEDAGDLLETADNDNWKQRKEIASHKRWMAERLDRPTWGQQQGQTLSLNVQSLHLSLLRTELPKLQVIETHTLGSGETADCLSDGAPEDGQIDTPG